jgi:hypothetical protein
VSPPLPSSPPSLHLNAQQAAERGLKALIARAKIRPAQYGFADANEAGRAVLGPGYDLEQLRTNELKQWASAPQPVPPPFLTMVQRRLYLVKVAADVRAVIIIAKSNQGWTPIDMGNKPVARDIAAAAQKWPTAQSLVYVPSLHLYLLKAPALGPTQARFAPVRDSGTLKQGVEVPSQPLFQTLFNRLPPGVPDNVDLVDRPPF